MPASLKEDCLMAQKKLESVFRTFQLSSFILCNLITLKIESITYTKTLDTSWIHTEATKAKSIAKATDTKASEAKGCDSWYVCSLFQHYFFFNRVQI